MRPARVLRGALGIALFAAVCVFFWYFDVVFDVIARVVNSVGLLYLILGIVLGLVVLEVLLRLFGPLVARVFCRSKISEVSPQQVGYVLWGGFNNARLLCKDFHSQRRVDFVKKVPRNGPTQFVMTVEARFCSPEEFAAVQGVLRDHGVKYKVEKDPKRGTERLSADFGPAPELVAEVTRAIFTRGYGIGENETILVRGTGAVALPFPGTPNPYVPKIIGWEGQRPPAEPAPEKRKEEKP